ncbi:MAG: hypothetical protein KOO61_06110 [Spirochaetales bacterium]|nr:hypothetical protein [Spirochaetales bacterium]
MIPALGIAAVTLLIACHPLVNPVDPQSTTYTGIPTGSDGDAPDPILPAAVKWELTASHNPGRMLPLEVTADGSFIEPRNAGSFELWITLSDSFDWEQAEGAVLWIAATVLSGDTLHFALHLNEVAPEQRRLGWHFWPDGITNQTRARLRLVDRNGTIIGERVVGRLIGDVDGNGTVESGVGGDDERIDALVGFPVGTDNPETIRADLDLDGTIQSMNDGNVVSDGSYLDTTLPATAPTFPD